MPLHLYALVENPARLPSVAGIANRMLSSVAFDGFAAVVSESDADAVDDIEAAVLAHAAVVDATGRLNDPILPVRFGGAIADAEQLAATLVDRRAKISDAFDRVRGCVELGLRVVTSSNMSAPAQSGREYMQARLDGVRAAERLADAIDTPLAELARERTRQILATPNLALSAAYLVPHDSLAAFRERVDALAARQGEAQLVCTGPWPPYTFAMIDPHQ